MLNALLLSVQILFFVIGGYQLFLSFYGWFREKKKASHEPEKTFAVLVAAHNEEEVVGALIENLQNLNYPKELYDIFVIADNCTDRTAEISKSMGVRAMERHNLNLRGKGYAIEWMLKKLWGMKRSYDAVVMFDADNLVSKDFLREMNNDLIEGKRVIQGYLDTKNPYDSWISAANGITYWFCNRLWQLPRTNLKLSNFLGGTGMCFETKLLKEMGWGATSLVEDLEFTIRCIQRNVYPHFNYDAKVYDEKPLTFRASSRQRLRWMQGHFDVVRRYFLPLLWQGLKERSWVKLDASLYILNAYNYLAGFLVTIILWTDSMIPGENYFTSLYNELPIWFTIPMMIYVYGQTPLAMMMEKVHWKLYLRLITFPIFFLSWWPITFYAFFTQNNKQWSHTKHTRVIRLEDMQSKQI
ncbi:glycosyltransferase family 2 protein [Paenibacillus gansuensis]|uniref:Glycosyltransferase family 2 protein n=1 Tax=Paenibacillus gansuensis TaxID=306542 RepID=A0ABW5P955_9BACL